MRGRGCERRRSSSGLGVEGRGNWNRSGNGTWLLLRIESSRRRRRGGVGSRHPHAASGRREERSGVVSASNGAKERVRARGRRTTEQLVDA